MRAFRIILAALALGAALAACSPPVSGARQPVKTDAKAFLNTSITRVRGRRNRYVDYKEAIRLVRLWPDTSRVGAVDSFQRFSKLVTGQDKAAFQQTGDACADLVHQAAQMGRA